MKASTPTTPTTPTTASASASPHGQLLEGYASLKKEKEALDMLTVLQTAEQENLRLELDATTNLLEQETNKVAELEARLSLKSASIDCQLAEAARKGSNGNGSNHQEQEEQQLAEAMRENQALQERIIFDLESSLENKNSVCETLLQRVAVLARRDQLQKASINTFQDEIFRLTADLALFEDRFASLANQATETKDSLLRNGGDRQEDTCIDSERPTIPSLLDTSAREQPQTQERVHTLELLVEALQTNKSVMQTSFMNTLSKHQRNWNDERKDLEEKISELIFEKEAIEQEVKEIALLLEKDSRYTEALATPTCSVVE
uniref:Uncharacterized protein n=1 Tax=Pseudo-nitzschia australis TaxID=44445 RepID=A0A7S4ASB3_9STRA|mmetsp:Transcript_18131/g.39525  ORF Transcript_18131/g.39525 Transcript_18131/m.39525 type:complete len:319 (+) Transcript_18131:155-1111(+)|eukprot:CAMPEP_0168199486 /NCGR_PEP_ID=MMETSP0139_2-20121125/22451_1 /TAXON_ID=44445 /ORGANISM="Pseudo-nitzschia australis, Strain 10249 10 AB" /LENGTH=318 /DNA_ID=CAMNT_0008124483 /DNA_START=115 /DNA_END=1071 /DNA_ORIENTATION=-